MTKTSKHLGTITILINDRHKNSRRLNDLLSEKGSVIMSRLGVNVEPACISGCTAIIALAVKGTNAEINDLTKKINQLKNIKAKAIIITK